MYGMYCEIISAVFVYAVGRSWCPKRCICITNCASHFKVKRGQVCPYLEEQREGFPGISPGNVVYTLATILSPHYLLSGFVQTKQTFVFTS